MAHLASAPMQQIQTRSVLQIVAHEARLYI
jgi:hypothetical protein